MRTSPRRSSSSRPTSCPGTSPARSLPWRAGWRAASSTTEHLVHWDDVEPRRSESGHLGGAWRDLGSAAGSWWVGVKRIEIDPGKWSTPAHVEGAEEEIFFVLGGSGLSWQDGQVYEVGEGDCIVHLARGAAHTLRAGDDGLDVLAFGMRVPLQIADLPRADVAWIFPTWTEAGTGDHPWAREIAAGEPEVGEPAERPKNIVNVRDVPAPYRMLGAAAGSDQTGLNHVTCDPGFEAGTYSHCHSEEEELFVFLEGEGTVWLTPSPVRRELGVEEEPVPVRAGHVLSRPAGTGISHAFDAGDAGLVYLAFGTRKPNDVVYYPRADKLWFRGVGVCIQPEHVPRWGPDGKP